ncbi:MAG: MBL fold metallo-hydrolase [Caldisericaceae bacterium]
MFTKLYENANHKCVKFTGFDSEDEVSTNQFLIIDSDEAILFEPGGTRTNSNLFVEIASFIAPQKIKYIVLSHQDPDVGASLNFWLFSTNAKIVFSELWLRFIPHYASKKLADERTLGIPDHGMNLAIGSSKVVLIPAHFLHSEGNFQIYDPTSKILFTGDFGASVGVDYEVVNDFESHTKFMDAFHKRYMPSSFAIKKWVEMVRTLDVEQIVPQHGARIEGKQAVNKFLDWAFEIKPQLEENPDWYRIPE